VGALRGLQARIVFDQIRTFHPFLTSFLAAHVEKWPWRPKIRHGFDACDMVCKLAISADRKRDEQLLSETTSGSKALAQRAPES
jgi:hypothetical protein